jgi:hypothetical protein
MGSGRRFCRRRGQAAGFVELVRHRSHQQRTDSDRTVTTPTLRAGCHRPVPTDRCPGGSRPGIQPPSLWLAVGSRRSWGSRYAQAGGQGNPVCRTAPSLPLPPDVAGGDFSPANHISILPRASVPCRKPVLREGTIGPGMAPRAKTDRRNTVAGEKQSG